MGKDDDVKENQGKDWEVEEIVNHCYLGRVFQKRGIPGSQRKTAQMPLKWLRNITVDACTSARSCGITGKPTTRVAKGMGIELCLVQ